MKKKIAIICLMCLLLVLLAGCGRKIVDENGYEHDLFYGFAKLKEIDDFADICYDPKTKVCYIIIHSTYKGGISPYYIINENGKPEIAVYGVNYK